MNDEAVEFPEISYRGLSQNDWIDDYGLVTSGAFQTLQTKRDDDFSEISVNWNDDVNSIVNLKNATKIDAEGKEIRQFRSGYCEIDTAIMNKALKGYITVGVFSYERKPTIGFDGNIDNPYHGNLLIKNNIKPAAKRAIQATLASVAGFAKGWEDK